MDFIKLLEPYATEGRTIEGQVKWLLSKGLPQYVVNDAMTFVYTQLQNGVTLRDGTELDHYILRIAREYHDKDITEQLSKRVSVIEQNLDSEWNKLSKPKKLWEVVRGRA
jgi:hypothetical protein